MTKAMLFSFYGVEVEVHAPEEIRKDFSYFGVASMSESPAFKIRYHDIKNMVLPLNWKDHARLIFKTRMCTAYQLKALRICQYSENTIVVLENNSSAVCYSSDAKEAYQAIFYLILSRVGEELDLRGIHRLHAVGIDGAKYATCWPLPSGKGKTTKALITLLQSENKIFGDEIVLTDGSTIYPFPIRLSLREDVFQKFKDSVKNYDMIDRLGGETKYLIEIPKERIAENTINFEISANPFLFSFSFLFGLGIPQMREYMLRPGQAVRLARILFLRLICLIKLSPKLNKSNQSQSARL